MIDTSIADVAGRRVWDSRGRPTVEAEVTLADGAEGRAIAPAGASTGSGEAVDLRDGGEAFGGYDVAGRWRRSTTDRSALAGMDATTRRRRRGADRLDGTPNKSRLGGNATVATSMAVAHRGGGGRCRCGAISAATGPIPCRCRKSRSSAAAPMRGGASTCRTSW